MSEKPYEFVKAEDVEPCYDCKAESGCCGKFTCSFVAKLLKERDVYRDIAGLNRWKRGDVTVPRAVEAADAEARKLLSPQPSPRGRG